MPIFAKLISTIIHKIEAITPITVAKIPVTNPPTLPYPPSFFDTFSKTIAKIPKIVPGIDKNPKMNNKTATKHNPTNPCY